MKLTHKYLIVVLILLLVSVTYGFAADSIWVTSSGAKLKDEKSAASNTIAILPVGSKLEVMKLENRWYNVISSTGQTGWIYRGKVSRTAPKQSRGQGGGDTLGTLLGGLTGSKIESDTPDTSRSIRALDVGKSGDNQEASDQEDAQKALDRVLTFGATEKEIEQFLEAGSIGEYAPY
jgi:hypothetical protein